MDLRLSMIIDAVDRFTEPMRKVTSSTERASNEMRETQQRLKQLSGTAGDIENFRQLRTAQQQTSRQMQEAQQRVAQLSREMRNSDKVTAAMRREFERARREASKLSNQHTLQQQKLQQLRATLREAGVSTSDLRNAQRRLKEEIELQNRALQQQKQQLERVKDAQKQLYQARSKLSQAGGGMVAGAGTMTGGAATAVGMAQGAIESNSMAAILAAQKGLGSEQAKIYENLMQGVLQSSSSTREEIFQSIGAVTAAFGGLDKQSAESIAQTAKQADVFRKVYQVEASQSIQTVQQLIQNGFAKTATEAFDLLTTGFKSVNGEMRTELPEILNEYGTNFRALGFSGSESMALLIGAADKGKFVLDKTGDALKEFTLRGTDMSKKSIEAYDLIGLSASDMAAMIAKGGKGARLALMQTADKLLAIQDPVTRANAAISLFGTPIEDLSIDQIPQFLEVLSKSGKDLGNFAGATKNMADTLSSNVSERMKIAWNQFGVAKDKVIAKALPQITELIEKITAFMSENPKFTAALMTIISVMGVLAIFGGAITLIVSGFTALSAVVTILKAKMLLLNMAFLANPITWIALGIAALIAAGYLLIKNWDKVKAFFIGLWDKIKGAFSGAFDFIRNLFNWSPIGIIYNNWGAISSFFSGLFDGVIAVFSWAWNKITEFLGFNPISVLSSVFCAIGSFFIDIFNDVISVFSWAWEAINGFLSQNPITVLSSVFSGVASFFTSIWDGVKQIFFDTWDFIKNILSWNPLELITNIYNTIPSFFDSVIESIKGIFSKGFAFVKKVFISPIETIKNTLGGLWNKIFGDDEEKEIKAKVTKTEEQIPAVKKVNQNYGYQPYLRQPSFAGHNYGGYQPYVKPEIKPAQNVGSIKPSSKNNTINSNYNISITSNSENPKDIASEVRKQLDERDRQMATRNRGLLID